MLKEQLEDTGQQVERKQKVPALNELANLIGHELRNPLCVISNSVYYLNMILKKPDDKVKKHLSIIQNEVAQADKLLSDILDFSRSKPLTFVQDNVHCLIKALVSSIKTPQKILVRTDFTHKGYTTLFDPEQLKKVFFNIIINAFQAMPSGGHMDIKTTVNSDYLDISFKDCGEGIPQEYRERIFDPLFTTRSKGIGLGLTIADKIVKQHKGSIEVESKPGRGTTFTVKLPHKEV